MPAPRRAKGSGRDRGKQKGAPGSWLPWVAEPDEFVPHRPQGSCGCGADLAGVQDALSGKTGAANRAGAVTIAEGNGWL